MNTLKKLDSLPPLKGLVLLIGPPASGKSTFAHKLVTLGRLDNSSCISNDEIAKELFNVTVDRGSKDGAIFDEQDRRVAALLEKGKVAIVDATNVKPEARQRLITIAKRFNAPMSAFCFRRNSTMLLERNKRRDVEVPEKMLIEYALLMHQVTAEQLRAEGIGEIFDVSESLK